MDSVNFYYHEHELAHIDKDRYYITNYNDLSEEPEVEKTWTNKEGIDIPLFKLNRICGTVIDKDKNKNTLVLLTEEGVVKVLRNGEYVINPEPVTFYWGDRSLKVVETLDRDLKSASKYSPKIAHQARSIFAHCLHDAVWVQKYQNMNMKTT